MNQHFWPLLLLYIHIDYVELWRNIFLVLNLGAKTSLIRTNMEGHIHTTLFDIINFDVRSCHSTSFTTESYFDGIC